MSFFMSEKDPEVIKKITLMELINWGIGINLLNLLRVWDIWDEPIQSGTYKGWNRYSRDIVRTLPLHNTIRRAMSPEEALKFYTLSN